jgi:integrase
LAKLIKRHLDKLASLPPDRDRVEWDDNLSGFGVRVNPAGRIAFIVQYRIGRRSRRITIGSYGTYTPAQARDEAETLLSAAKAARKGLAQDPADRIRQEREAITFKELAAEYAAKSEAGVLLTRRKRPKKPSTVAIDRYRMAHLVRHFGSKPVKNIMRADCQRCLEALIAGRHGAGRTYGLLGGMLTYAVGQGYIGSNPAHGVPRPADGAREFRLDQTGYRRLGQSLESAVARGEPWQATTAIALLLLTGCRKGEIRTLRISEIDLQGRCLRLGDTKTGASTRALGEPALRVLRAALSRPGRPASPYLLPGRDPRRPFNGLGGAWDRIVGKGLTPHSLRHAFASTCDELELSELTIAMLLGHASARKGSVTRGYISRPDTLLLAAADKVSRFIWERMMGEPLSAEIIELRTAATNA